MPVAFITPCRWGFPGEDVLVPDDDRYDEFQEPVLDFDFGSNDVWFGLSDESLNSDRQSAIKEWLGAPGTNPDVLVAKITGSAGDYLVFRFPAEQSNEAMLFKLTFVG